ncbi:MAG: hypothetical protein KC475_04860 [Cyanobacteria bacterium HKST-UBA03]|nr:hypothetical protein [Cyanobacteria bacterium HKST-UBA03]
MAEPSIDSIDFQALVQQEVSQFVEGWQASGFTQEDIQEHFAKLFEMGGVCCQLIVQEGGIQPEGAQQVLPYNEAMATRLVHLFLIGMNQAIMKAYEQKLPSNEKWNLLQKSAIHVYEQGKQAIVATLGQENTPNVQISDEQIYGWLGQTAVEALLYYIQEYEHQNGPLVSEGEAGFPGMEPEAEGAGLEALPAQEAAPEVPAAPVVEAAPEPVPAAAAATVPPPVAQPQPQAPADIYHKYAAIGLISATLSGAQQTRLLASFDTETQAMILRYREPEHLITEQFDLKRVAFYVRSFKDRLGQLAALPRPKKENDYTTALAAIIHELPEPRIDKLFGHERPMVRGYIGQFVQQRYADEGGAVEETAPYQLAGGVEESLYYYLRRNFPDVWQKLSQKPSDTDALEAEGIEA